MSLGIAQVSLDKKSGCFVISTKSYPRALAVWPAGSVAKAGDSPVISAGRFTITAPATITGSFDHGTRLANLPRNDDCDPTSFRELIAVSAISAVCKNEDAENRGSPPASCGGFRKK